MKVSPKQDPRAIEARVLKTKCKVAQESASGGWSGGGWKPAGATRVATASNSAAAGKSGKNDEGGKSKRKSARPERLKGFPFDDSEQEHALDGCEFFDGWASWQDGGLAAGCARMGQWPPAQQEADEQHDFASARTTTDITLGVHQNVSAASRSQALAYLDMLLS